MIARSLSLRQRREIIAREFLSISVEPTSDGQWIASLMEEERELYRSSPQPTPAEALPFAVWELDTLVEKRVDAIYALERADELSAMLPGERAEYLRSEA